jgi:hypothetical protein
MRHSQGSNSVTKHPALISLGRTGTPGPFDSVHQNTEKFQGGANKANKKEITTVEQWTSPLGEHGNSNRLTVQTICSGKGAS